jgi:hypothetical protein
MNVWVEFKNFSEWQVKALFRNIFPSMDQDNEVLKGDIEGIDLPTTPTPHLYRIRFRGAFGVIRIISCHLSSRIYFLIGPIMIASVCNATRLFLLVGKLPLFKVVNSEFYEYT